MKPWQRDQLSRSLEQRRATLVEELRRDAARLREERSADVGEPTGGKTQSGSRPRL